MKVLICYATTEGQTRKIARFCAGRLVDAGIPTVFVDAADVGHVGTEGQPAVNGDAVKNPRELARKIGNFSPEEKVTVSLWRNGKSEDVEVTLGKLEGDAKLASASPSSSDMERLTSLGLALETAPDGKGVVVAEVAPDSPAARKGIEAGDIISSVNGEEVGDPEAVSRVVKEADGLGRKAALFQVQRGENSLFVALPLKRG